MSTKKRKQHRLDSKLQYLTAERQRTPPATWSSIARELATDGIRTTPPELVRYFHSRRNAMQANENLNNSLHIMLQGKGGVGKSAMSGLGAQFIGSKVDNLFVFDCDSENNTLSEYTALCATPLDILVDNEIDPAKFDGLMEPIISTRGSFFVDVGTSVFTPLLAYLLKTQAFQMIEASGKQVYIHTVIMGGDVENTLESLARIQLIMTGTNAKLVIWLNERDAACTVGNIDVLETQQLTLLRPATAGAVRVAKQAPLFRDSLFKLFEHRLTVAEVGEAPAIMLMEKQRIKLMADKIFRQLESLAW